MRRTLLVLVFVLLMAGAAMADSGGSPEASNVSLDLGAHYTLGLFSSQWSTNVSAVYRLNNLWLGGGLKGFFGAGYDAFYLAPYARLELGWLYGGIGPLILVQQPTGSEWATIGSPVSFLGTAGAGFPIVPIGPGWMGLEVGADVSITPFRVPETESTGNILADIFAALAVGAAGAVLNTLKISGGVFYTVGF